MQKGKRGRAKTYDTDSLMFRSVMGILLIALGILAIISIVGGIQGVAFTLVKTAMQGLGGGLCLGVPIFLVWSGVLVAFSARKKAPVRALVFLLILYLCVLGIVDLLSGIGETSLFEYAVAYNQGQTPPVPNAEGYWQVLTAAYRICGSFNAFGGALGMVIAWPLWKYVSITGGVTILSIISLICVLFFSKFDVAGTVRLARENMAKRAEQREIQKKTKVYMKEMEQTTETAASAQDDLLRPAYLRKTGKDAPPPPQTTIPTMPLQNPLDPQPEFKGAYPGLNAYLQTVPATGMPAGPMQTTFFGGQSAKPVLYDEMIVPEVPDGAKPSDWTLNAGKGKTREPAPREAFAQPSMQPMQPMDRETSKVVERMESIRQRKEQIRQKIEEGDGNGALDYGDTFAPARKLEGAVVEPTRKQGINRAKPDKGANISERVREDTARRPATPGIGEKPAFSQPQNPAQGQNPLMDAQLRAAQGGVQAAGYGTAGDRFAAYKRPDSATGREAALNSTQPDPAYLNQSEKRNGTAGQVTAPEKHPYPYPMIELLNLRTQTLPDTRDLDRANALRLEKTLDSFAIPAKVQRVTHGPAVTRFELGLASSGINVKRILNISDNIALDMAANGGVRIEVPIPGTTLFGVEIPNKEIISVSLAEVLTSPEMTAAKSPLSVALGKDIAGRPVICDLAKMPHLLIAGQTGSGKSVCINSIINSLLFRATPEEVRMIMIDPKVVELQGYNHVPHLLIPVVSDPHKAAGALAWAVQEMLDRYHKMQSKGVREITAYNAKVKGDEPKLPRIVIIIDELSDLMLACKKEVEESIIRLAQLARAAGIHVVIATQRPTVNVITGLIKANVPSRIAFAVASSIDSRTILDMNGAEKLLGKGDMFYFPTGEKAPLRVQGCYLSDAEISNVVDYIGMNSETDYDERINEMIDAPEAEDADSATAEDDLGADDRLQEAVEMVLTDGQASISMLQRRMKIGYARAGRLIDDMAARGIVSKSQGSKPREVLISFEQYSQQQDMYLR